MRGWLCARRHRQEGVAIEGLALHFATDSVRHHFRENLLQQALTSGDSTSDRDNK